MSARVGTSVSAPPIIELRCPPSLCATMGAKVWPAAVGWMAPSMVNSCPAQLACSLLAPLSPRDVLLPGHSVAPLSPAATAPPPPRMCRLLDPLSRSPTPRVCVELAPPSPWDLSQPAHYEAPPPPLPAPPTCCLLASLPQYPVSQVCAELAPSSPRDPSLPARSVKPPSAPPAPMNSPWPPACRLLAPPASSPATQACILLVPSPGELLPPAYTSPDPLPRLFAEDLPDSGLCKSNRSTPTTRKPHNQRTTRRQSPRS
mmetsp:Transcript_81020/g.203977  ORF Transcript_81020/g.203977 Transcript_81020/m.203977 type:complete len:259 (-) Transcript_81020:963-1739(-)